MFTFNKTNQTIERQRPYEQPTVWTVEEFKQDLSTIRIYEIASVIINSWDRQKQLQSDAWLYLNAMCYLENITDYYGDDSAKEIVLRFCLNCTTYRGEIAKLVKAELKRRCKQ